MRWAWADDVWRSDEGDYAVTPVNVWPGQVAWQVSRAGVRASALLFKHERDAQRLAEWDYAVLEQARERQVRTRTQQAR